MVENEAVVFNEIKDKIQKVVLEVIETTISKKVYHPRDAQTWTSTIPDGIMKVISEFNKNFKYMVNCIVMQKNDSGLNVTNTSYWNADIDGSCTVKWENPNVLCIVNVYGVGL